MRRIYVRETEYEIIDNFYEPKEIYPMLQEEPKRRWPKALFWAAVAIGIIVGISTHDSKAQQGVNRFYGWEGYRGYNAPNVAPSVQQYSGPNGLECYEAGSTLYCRGPNVSFTCNRIGSQVVCR